MCNDNNIKNASRASRLGRISNNVKTIVVALNPEDSNKTRDEYGGWIVGLCEYSHSIKDYFNNVFFKSEREKHGDGEIDAPTFLNAIAVMNTDTVKDYKPLTTCRKGIDDSGETSAFCKDYHMTTEMALGSAFADKPTVVVFSDNVGDAVPNEYNGEYDKLKGDPREFIGIPICFYIGNIGALAQATSCSYCIALLRDCAFKGGDYQLVLLYGNEEVDKNEQSGCIHYVPFNSRSEIEKYIETYGTVDKVMINLFIRTMNGELTKKKG